MRITAAASTTLLLLACFTACSGRLLEKEIGPDTSATEPEPDDRPTKGTETRPSRPKRPGSSSPPDESCEPAECTLPSAPGFSPVLFGEASATCPAGFESAEVVEDPTAGPEACSCGACSAAIDCSAGPIASFHDDDGKCDQRGKVLQANGGACSDESGRFGDHASVAAPRPIVGACSAEGVASRAAVSTRQKRACTPAPSACLDAACDAPAGLAACLAKDGDVECPASAPVKHLVGSDVSVRCGPCRCEVDATCSGQMHFFERERCQGSPSQTLRAYECKKTKGGRFASTRWQGAVGAVRCRKDAPPPPAVELAETRTICCPS